MISGERNIIGKVPAQARGKRRKRGRKNKRRKAPLPLEALIKLKTKQDLYEEHNMVIREESDEKVFENKAEVERKKVKTYRMREVEAFISNIPYSAYAKDLALFLKDELKKAGYLVKGQASIVRSQIIEKKREHSGRALVVLESEEAFKILEVRSTLLFLGRTLRINRGNGKSKYRRKEKIIFLSNINIMQIGTPLPKHQYIENFIFDHEFNGYNELEISSQLSIDTNKRCFRITFQYEKKNYRAEIPMKRIRQLSIDRVEDSLTLSFRSQYPPRLFRKEETIFSLMGISVPPYLWENEVDDENEDDQWMRTPDPTTVNVFGRCTMYRLILSDSVLMESLFTGLKDFLLLPKKRIEVGHLNPGIPRFLKEYIFPDFSIGEYNEWKEMKRDRVSFSTRYLLHCLVGSNKIDLINSMNKVEEKGEKKEMALLEIFCCFTTRKCDAVLKFLLSSPKFQFIHSLPETLLHVFHTKIQVPELLLDDNSDDDDDDAPTEGQTDDQMENLKLKNSVEVEEEWEEEEEDEENVSELMPIRHLWVTPLRICPRPAELEQSNRIIRHFRGHLDRFLRVTFVDENFGSVRIALSTDMQIRVRKVLEEGIVVGGRKFCFLAFSNSQIREESCWFYCQEPDDRFGFFSIPTAEEVRNWIGDLSSITVIAKYAARLGQAFSVTLPTETFSSTQTCEVPDVERNGFCFSDGVGMISESCAVRIAESSGLEPVPSAFQIRYGGGKGMLTVMPDRFSGLRNCEIAFRKSMIKFPSTHRELGINGNAKKIPMYLNRQLITILSSRGVPDQTFLTLLTAMTAGLDRAINSNEAAKSLLEIHTNVGLNEHSLSPMTSVWYLLDSGIGCKEDPYVEGMVLAVCNKLLTGLQMKARIHVPEAMCLFGVMDETFTLEEEEVFVQLSSLSHNHSTESKVPRGESLVGKQVAVGRNPSLHPGDVRLLTVVDVPALRHLKDVLVFPARGSRPHPNEMSGGDLDGDIFFVIWDESLLCLDSFPPMDFSTVKKESPKMNPDGVTTKDITDFFLNYMKNDNLGIISNAHLVHADMSEEGAKCHNCLLLAELHSTAVDFVKTGIPAEFPKELRISTFPTFMGKKDKSEYESKKVLGKIYSICTQKINYSPITKQVPRYYQKGSPVGTLDDPRIDKDLLVPGYEVYVNEAYGLLQYYNSKLLEVMRHFGVFNETELLSGCVSSFSRRVCPKGGRGGMDAQNRLNNEVKVLRKEFKDIFWEEFQEDNLINEKDGSVDQVDFSSLSIQEKTESSDGLNDQQLRDKHAFELFVQQESSKKASAWYFVTYSQERDFTDSNDFDILRSFAWIVFNVLCKNKTIFLIKDKKVEDIKLSFLLSLFKVITIIIMVLIIKKLKYYNRQKS